MLHKLGDDSIMTMGADRPDIDYEAAWRRELGAPAVAEGQAGGWAGLAVGWETAGFHGVKNWGSFGMARRVVRT